jgi:hypothetical protein
MTVRNNADAEVDYYLWPGLTTSQKGSYTYKDWNGNSQWYMVKDASNNWALNSAVGGLDSFKAYQSTNSGDTYIDASNTTGHIRLNYESGSGSETDIYSGSSANLVAAFLGPTSIKFPGLAASSGHFCLQVDTSGYLTNTGAACGSGSGSGGTSGTINSGSAGQIAYYTASGTTIGGTNAVPLTSGGTGATSASGAVANLLPGVASDGNNGLTVTGSVKAAESIPALSPWCDIRSQGAVIDGATPIDSAVQACINLVVSAYGATGTVRLSCAAPGGNAGCYWANPEALTKPGGLYSQVNLEIEGAVALGAGAFIPTWINVIGIGGSRPGQFGGADSPATISAPNCAGTIGTAITTTGSQVNITPTFSTGSIACMPAGGALTTAGYTTVSGTVTGTRATETGQTYGVATLTLPSSGAQPRYLISKTITISGCSDSAFNLANTWIASVDYGAVGGEQVSYYIPTTGTGSATGCTTVSFDDDKHESMRTWCSNGVEYGGGSPTCGANQLTVYANFQHSAADLWGAVAAGPDEATATAPQVWKNISIQGSWGESFWGENEAFATLSNIQVGPRVYPAAGGMEQSSSWWTTVDNLLANGGGATGCTGGSGAGNAYGGHGCTEGAYPYGLLCDNSPEVGYGGANTGCAGFIFSNTKIQDGAVKFGNKGGGVNAFPTLIDGLLDELAPGAGIVIDNRAGVEGNCLDVKSMALQDGYTPGFSLYDVAYTDSEPSYGCVKLENPSTVAALPRNPYVNGGFTVDPAAPGTTVSLPANNSGPSGSYSDGIEQQGPRRNDHADFGPQILPFGSANINNSPSYWSTTGGCSGAHCSVTTTNVYCPDGTQATSAMLCAAITNPASSGYASPIPIGSVAGGTYAGDTFIIGCKVKPWGQTTASGIDGMANAPFYIETAGTDTFTNSPTGLSSYGLPTGFGTNLGSEGWYHQAAIVTIGTGESTSHTITFYLTIGYAQNGQGNAYSNCFMTPLIPGVNNPSYAGVTALDLAYARDNQYRGCVPPNVAAGQLATCESGAGLESNITGVRYGNGTGADTAATAAQLVAAIGSTAVANATTAANFSGSLSGDVTGTQSATTVGKINGGAVPASASVLSSNSSSQLTAATNITTTTSSTLGGSANLFNNAAAATNVVEIQAGTSAAQTEELQWQNYSGTAEWDNTVDTSYNYRIQDAAHSSLDRITIYQGGGNTNINAGNGAYEVCLNCAANSGTAGLVVQNGASSPSTVLTVTGSGNTTATGFVSGKFFMGNGTMTLATGAAAGSSPSIACATSHVCDGVSGTVTLTTGTSPTTGTLATISFPNTHSNYANCMVTTESASAVITTNTWTESTTAITITANAALTASTAYTVKYWCGGN